MGQQEGPGSRERGRSVSLSSPCRWGGTEGNGLEPSTPFHRAVNTNLRKIILETLIFDSEALIVYGTWMGVGLNMPGF